MATLGAGAVVAPSRWRRWAAGGHPSPRWPCRAGALRVHRAPGAGAACRALMVVIDLPVVAATRPCSSPCPTSCAERVMKACTRSSSPQERGARGEHQRGHGQRGDGWPPAASAASATAPTTAPAPRWPSAGRAAGALTQHVACEERHQHVVVEEEAADGQHHGHGQRHARRCAPRSGCPRGSPRPSSGPWARAACLRADDRPGSPARARNESAFTKRQRRPPVRDGEAGQRGPRSAPR